MKRVLLLLFVFLFSLSFVFCQSGTGDLRDSLDEKVETIDKTKDKIDSIRDTKWDYLGEKWKAIFLSNPIFKGIDSFFSEISFVFKILMGVDYSFSFGFFYLIFVFIYLFFNLAYFISSLSIFKKWISFGLSFVICGVFGQIGFYNIVLKYTFFFFNLISDFIEFFIFALLLFIVLLLMFFYYFERVFSGLRFYFIKKSEDIKKAQEIIDRTILHSFTNKIKNLFSSE